MPNLNDAKLPKYHVQRNVAGGSWLMAGNYTFARISIMDGGDDALDKMIAAANAAEQPEDATHKLRLRLGDVKNFALALLRGHEGDSIATDIANALLRLVGSSPQKPKDVASGWSEREEVVQSVLLQCAENGIPITRHAVRIILEQISQNREALDFLARH